MKHTVEALLSMSDLSPTLLPMPHLHHQLLLKLAINSVINPLTAILGSGSLPNGALFGSPPAHILIRQLAKETSQVIQAYLSSLSEPHAPPPDVLRLFSTDSLERRVLEVVKTTSENVSSMAGDVSRGRLTEIDHINGYLRALGRRLKIATPHHDMVIAMVRYTTEINGLSPWVSERHSRLVEGKKGWLVKQWKRAPRTASQFERLEKQLELEERRVLLAEKKLLLAERATQQSERQRQRRLEVNEVGPQGRPKSKLRSEVEERIQEAIEQGKEGAEELEVPKSRIERRKLLRALAAGESATPRDGTDKDRPRPNSQEDDHSSDPPRPLMSNSASSSAAPASSSAPPESSETAPPQVGAAARRDHMTFSGPRQERTWDVPPSPPTAQEPVPEKRHPSGAVSADAAGSRDDAESPAHTPPSSSSTTAKPPSMQEMMSSMIASAARQGSDTAIESNVTPAPASSSAFPQSESPSQPEHPSIPKQSSSGSPFGSSIDSLISSAPRATRTWDTKGGTITGYTSAAPSLAATVGIARMKGQDLARAGLGSVLDNLIGASPRQERTWDVEAKAETGKDSGKYSTSRTSGS
jgi:hypothetical protein